MPGILHGLLVRDRRLPCGQFDLCGMRAITDEYLSVLYRAVQVHLTLRETSQGPTPFR